MVSLMSAFPSGLPEGDYRDHQSTYQPLFSYPGVQAESSTATDARGDNESQPLLRHSRAYRCRSSPSSSRTQHQGSSINLLAQPMTEDRNSLTLFSETELNSLDSNDTVLTVDHSSAMESAVPLVGPNPARVGQDQQVEDQEGMLLSRAEQEGVGDGASMQVAWEGRVDRRKTNRFRLTHSQTRYLMSEFARQAHPDVAQRERLSREIPGLSPRQVQVWFQNRRAKLKRLTSDDRDRTTRSRALPDDFDMSHALQPFSTGSQSSGSPTSAPPSRTSTFTDNETTGPSTFGALSLHGEDENVVSPVSMNSAFSTFFTPPGSCSASDGLSPRSTTSDRSQFGAFPNSENTSPECVSPFIRSRGFSTAYSSHPHTTSLQIHEPKSRPRGEMLASPFRSSSAYQRSPEAYADFQPTSTRNPSTSNVSSQPHWDVESNRSIYGVGYSNGGFQPAPLALARTDPTTMDRFAFSQRPSHPGLDTHVSMPSAPLSANFQHETQWSRHDHHSTLLTASYPSGSVTATSDSFYVFPEPLAQGWGPGMEQHLGRTTESGESYPAWQQHQHDGRNVHDASPHHLEGNPP